MSDTKYMRTCVMCGVTLHRLYTAVEDEQDCICQLCYDKESQQMMTQRGEDKWPDCKCETQCSDCYYASQQVK